MPRVRSKIQKRFSAQRDRASCTECDWTWLSHGRLPSATQRNAIYHATSTGHETVVDVAYRVSYRVTS